VPTGIPISGFSPSCDVPFTTTLPGTKETPDGSASFIITFVEGTVPLFWNVTVKVIVSPISATCRSADFVVVGLGLLIGMFTLGVVVVVVTGGSLGFG